MPACPPVRERRTRSSGCDRWRVRHGSQEARGAHSGVYRNGWGSLMALTASGGSGPSGAMLLSEFTGCVDWREAVVEPTAPHRRRHTRKGPTAR